MVYPTLPPKKKNAQALLLKALKMIRIPLHDILSNMGLKSKNNNTTDRDKAGIPYTSRDHINLLKQDYEEKTRAAQDPSLDSCFNYCWALVHSNPTGSDREAAYRDIDLGLNLIQALLSQMPDSLDGGRRRELLYIQAVGEYRKGEYLNARSILRAVLESYPDFRQAESLLEYVENELVKEGLIGLGAGAAIIGVLGAVTVAALSSGGKKR